MMRSGNRVTTQEANAMNGIHPAILNDLAHAQARAVERRSVEECRLGEAARAVQADPGTSWVATVGVAIRRLFGHAPTTRRSSLHPTHEY
jgi:hypothetical protein